MPAGAPAVRLLFALGDEPVTLDRAVAGELLLDTAETRFGGPGSTWPAALRARSAVVVREEEPAT